MSLCHADSVLSEPSETTKLHPRTMTVHPKFLNSLEVTHTDWIFGGVAELIDNARDAGATRYLILSFYFFHN